MNLVVAGDGPLRHLVPNALGIVPHDELERLYDASSVFVLPSRSEGFGIVAAEAMAHGRPVVACGVGGLAEVVADGETGILVPPRRPDLLRAALERLQRDPELRRRLGRAGRARAESRYSWDSVVARTIDVYADATTATAATR